MGNHDSYSDRPDPRLQRRLTNNPQPLIVVMRAIVVVFVKRIRRHDFARGIRAPALFKLRLFGLQP